MEVEDKLYRIENYNVQKSINVENAIYIKLKTLQQKYDATISEIVNICIEKLIVNNDIKYYCKPEGEICEYRSFMIRRENLEVLEEIKRKTGISITRLVNLAIKEF